MPNHSATMTSPWVRFSALKRLKSTTSCAVEQDAAGDQHVEEGVEGHVFL